MEVERLRRLRRLTELLEQYRALPLSEKRHPMNGLPKSQFCGGQNTPEPPPHTLRDVDANHFPPDKPPRLDAITPRPHIEYPVAVDSRAGVHEFKYRTLQEAMTSSGENSLPSDLTYNEYDISSDTQSALCLSL